MRSLDGRFDPKKWADLAPGKEHPLGKLGLVLRVSADGSRGTWSQKLSVNGVGRWATIGTTDDLTWKDVEAAATSNRAVAKRGRDPATEKLRAAKKDERASRTLSDVLKAMREAKAPALAERTREAAKTRHRVVEGHDIGKVPISQLTTQDVVEFLRPLLLSKTATALKVQRALSNAWGYARAMGWVDQTAPNPCDRDTLKHLLPAADRIRKPVPHRAPGWEAAPEFWKALAPYSGTGATALKLTLLCGTRTVETMGAEWSEVDLTARTWTVPAKRSKVRRDLTIPLSDAALHLLIELKAVKRGAYVFPSHSAAVPASNMAMLAQLGRMGWRGRLVAHGTRSMLRSWATANGVQREVAEMLIGHHPRGLDKVYMRDALLPQRREALQRWGKFVVGADAAERAEDAPSAMVIPMSVRPRRTA